MKFSVSSADLSIRLQNISKVQNSKNTLLILDNILFVLRNGELTLTASDSEITVTTKVEVSEVEGEGVFAVNSRTLIGSVKEIPEQPITFTVDTNDYSVRINYQNGEYNFTGVSGEEFPLPTTIKGSKHSVRINSKQMLNGITRCLFATSDDELRPQMNGIYFDMSNDIMAFAASDGHKLIRNRIFSVHPEDPSSFILPKKPAILLKTILPRFDEEVTVRFDSNNAVFTVEYYTITCRLIEGRYPNYNAVIPQDNPFKVTVDRASFISALRRVLVFASSSCSVVKIQVDRGTMTVSAQDIDFSTSAEERLICEYDGTPMSIGFNGPFLLDVLNCITCESVILELADPSRAGVILPSEMEGEEDLIMLLMPMMVKN